MSWAACSVRCWLEVAGRVLGGFRPGQELELQCGEGRAGGTRPTQHRWPHAIHQYNAALYTRPL